MSLLVAAAKVLVAIDAVARVSTSSALQSWTAETLVAYVQCVGAPRAGALVAGLLALVAASALILHRARREALAAR